MRLRVHHLECHETKDGYTIPLYRDIDLKGNVDAVRMAYVTTVNYGESKGPIVHARRQSLVTSLDGHLLEMEYEDPDTGDIIIQKLCDDDLYPLMVEVPPGVAVLYRNVADRFGDQTYGMPGTLVILADYCWRPNDDESTKYDGWEDYRARNR